MIYLVRKNLTPDNSLIHIKEKDFHYIFNVRRLEKTESLFIFSEECLYETILENATKKEAFFKIIREKKLNSPEKKLTLVLPFADMTALEASIKNSIEAGVNNIVFVETERSNLKKQVLSARFERLQAIAESAASQSRRRFFPELSLGTTSEIIKKEALHIAFHPYKKSVKITDNLNNFNDIFIWIGPEGGFSEKEILFFEQNGALFTSLKTPILRMETASALAVGFVRNSIGYDSEIWNPEI